MRKIDSRHLVFHILVALYFIWMVVFAILLGMAVYNTYGNRANSSLSMLFRDWILTNLVMGSVLFMVIRMFRNRTLLDKIIFYSFCFMGTASIIVLLLQ
ncbi:hypothetical protein [Flavobacterium sp. NRK1]|uniref:hypothetical protein n=1 Tax=Flavobacterium sp. NRK1 TaxID=2954929 RepID=UPI0020926E31|nr:hypothetical protein [Flavobacterium sp. NRK1]MCO6148459.1 hypothetical protein [Flavobacterium sp. NRK1]